MIADQDLWGRDVRKVSLVFLVSLSAYLNNCSPNSTGCPEGYYGEHCLRTCQCEKGQVCDPVIGCSILGSHQGMSFLDNF